MRNIKKEYNVLISVADDDSHIIIDFVDVEQTVRYYDDVLDKGEYQIPLTLTSESWGEKELYVYINSELYSNDRIYFAVEEG